MSTVVDSKGQTLNLNEIYAFLMDLVPKCGQIVRDAFYKEKTTKEKESYADFGIFFSNDEKCF